MWTFEINSPIINYVQNGTIVLVLCLIFKSTNYDKEQIGIWGYNLSEVKGGLTPPTEVSGGCGGSNGNCSGSSGCGGSNGNCSAGGGCSGSNGNCNIKCDPPAPIPDKLPQGIWFFK